jgi:hypothetical protein
MPSLSSKSFLKTKSMSSSRRGSNDNSTSILVTIALILFIIIAGTIIYNSYFREKFTGAQPNKLVYLYMENCGFCKEFNNVWNDMSKEDLTKYKINMEKYDLNDKEYQEYKLSNEDKEELKSYLLKRLNNNGFIFSNLNILDKLVCYKNEYSYIIKPFAFTADIINLNDSFKFNIDMFIKKDDLYYSPIKLGLPKIISIKIFKNEEETCMYEDNKEDNNNINSDSDSDNIIPNTINLTETIKYNLESD